MAQIVLPFLDANVLFTAAYNPAGLAAALIARQARLKIRFRTSGYAIEEALHNLQIKSPASLTQFRVLVAEIEIVKPQLRAGYNPLKLPESDLPIFQAALISGSTHLLTGDQKDFGRWMNRPAQTFGLVIQTIRDFADRL